MKSANKNTELGRLLNDVEKVANLMFSKNWSEKNAGNISIKLPLKFEFNHLQEADPINLQNTYPHLSNSAFYVTGAGKRMQHISESAKDNGLFIRINESGNKCHVFKTMDDKIHPTSELASHLGIHNMIAERGSDEKVVLHTHATEMIILTQHPNIKTTESLNKILWSMHPETMMFIPKGVGLVLYQLPGSKEIAESTIHQFKNHDIVVWEKHGIFAIGKNIIETFDNIDIVCKAASIWLQCKSAGFEPEGLTDEQLKEIKLSLNI